MSELFTTILIRTSAAGSTAQSIYKYCENCGSHWQTKSRNARCPECGYHPGKARDDLEPRPYQIFRPYLYPSPLRIMGRYMGKTSALSTPGLPRCIEENKTLIVALRVAQSVWPEEVQKWDQFHDFKIVPDNRHCKRAH